MAIANAPSRIGRALFPSLIFSPTAVANRRYRQVLNVQSALWAIGTNAAESIFTGGARRATKPVRESGYDASVAAYRKTV